MVDPLGHFFALQTVILLQLLMHMVLQTMYMDKMLGLLQMMASKDMLLVALAIVLAVLQDKEGVSIPVGDMNVCAMPATLVPHVPIQVCIINFQYERVKVESCYNLRKDTCRQSDAFSVY